MQIESNHRSYPFFKICPEVWRAFRWKILKSNHKISWYLQKRCFARKKTKLLEKIRHFEKFKPFFYRSNVRLGVYSIIALLKLNFNKMCQKSVANVYKFESILYHLHRAWVSAVRKNWWARAQNALFLAPFFIPLGSESF